MTTKVERPMPQDEMTVDEMIDAIEEYTNQGGNMTFYVEPGPDGPEWTVTVGNIGMKRYRRRFKRHTFPAAVRAAFDAINERGAE